jgi:hypothetical protein
MGQSLLALARSSKSFVALVQVVAFSTRRTFVQPSLHLVDAPSPAAAEIERDGQFTEFVHSLDRARRDAEERAEASAIDAECSGRVDAHVFASARHFS